MYATHNPQIAAAMRADVNVFKRGALFAILSIRQPFTRVPEQLGAVLDGDLSHLFGFKAQAWGYIQDNACELWNGIKGAHDNAERLAIVCQVPGLGVVKGAFVLQLMGYDVACLDARNIAREGRNPRAYRSDGEKGKAGKAWARKIAAYLAEVEGRAEFYWDAWCHDVAQVYDLAPFVVSEMHLSIVPDDYVPF